EEQDVRRRREEERVLLGERGVGSGREPSVRLLHAAPHREEARDAPDDEENEEEEERHPRPALPRPAASPTPDDVTVAAVSCAVDRAPRCVGPPRPLARRCRQRHLALRAAALVDAVGLLSGGGHPAGYGTR